MHNSASNHKQLIEELVRAIKAETLAGLKRNEAVSLVQSLQDGDFRHIRASIMSSGVNHLASAIKDVQFPFPMYANSDGIWMQFDSVWLRCDGDGYYTRYTSDAQSLGHKIGALLRKYNITPSTVLDIGANQGEVSFWFANQFPSARVVAVEASTETCSVLRGNVAMPLQRASNVEVYRFAVADKDGTIEFSMGLGTQNSVVPTDGIPTETVESVRLTTLWQRLELDIVEFLKIDIEGAEPLLTRDLSEVGHRVQSALIEFSSSGPIAGYKHLTDQLFSQGFQAEWGGTQYFKTEDLMNRLLVEILSQDKAADIFFVRL